MSKSWDVFQGDKWIAEITASSPSEAVQAVSSEHGLDSTAEMDAIEFSPYIPVAVELTAKCIGCGCDDYHACWDEAAALPCGWLRVDRALGLGVCSCCQEQVDRWDAGDTSLPAHLAPISKYIRADMVSVELGDPSDWAAVE